MNTSKKINNIHAALNYLIKNEYPFSFFHSSILSLIDTGKTRKDYIFLNQTIKAIESPELEELKKHFLNLNNTCTANPDCISDSGFNFIRRLCSTLSETIEKIKISGTQAMDKPLTNNNETLLRASLLSFEELKGEKLKLGNELYNSAHAFRSQKTLPTPIKHYVLSFLDKKNILTPSERKDIISGVLQQKPPFFLQERFSSKSFLEEILFKTEATETLSR